MKSKLAKTANSLKIRILEKIENWCNETVAEIQADYGEMQDRISKTPEDEKQLVELKAFIKHSKEVRMAELFQLLIEIEQHYELMDEYSFQYDEEKYQNCLLLKQFPMIISEIISDGQANIQQKEEDFI